MLGVLIVYVRCWILLCLMPHILYPLSIVAALNFHEFSFIISVTFYFHFISIISCIDLIIGFIVLFI